MKHSDFQEQHHWLCGLSEYFRFTESYEDDFELIFRALYHDNKYRKRDFLINMTKKYARKELLWDPSNGVRDAKTMEMSDKLQSFFNIAMHTELEDYEVKARQLIGLIAWYMPEEELIARTARFMQYFANNELDLPDLGDFFSRGQIRSKIWLVSELANVVGTQKLGNVVFYGGWYNFIAHFLYSQFDINKIISLDKDPAVIGPCKRLYAEELDDNRFASYFADVNECKWDGTELFYINSATRERLNKDKEAEIKQYDLDVNEMSTQSLGSINMVVNTSCEHMDNQWYDDLPEGTLVCLHQNDYFSNEQHVNCMKDIEDTKANYPMSNILYEGEIDTYLYNRFMLIGYK